MQRTTIKSLIHAGIIIIIGCIIYSNTLHVPFVFDDLIAIKGSVDVQTGNFSHLWATQTTRFIPLASFVMQNGRDVTSFHITNIAIHIATALLVYIFSLTLITHTQRKRTENAELQALAISLLFLTAPIQTQAITYVVQRITAIATLFYIATLTFYAYGRINKKQWSIALSIIIAVCAMFTKEIAVTIPLSIIAMEYCFFSASWKKKTWKKTSIPVLLMGSTIVIIPLTLLITRGHVTSAPSFPVVQNQITSSDPVPQSQQLVLSSKEYFFTQLSVIPNYMRLLIAPTSLNLDHDIPTVHSIFSTHILASILLLTTIFVLSFRLRKTHPLISFGILFFFIALSLESTIFPIEDVMFEHRAYLPSIGFFFAIVSAIFTIPLVQKKPAITMSILAVIVCAYGNGTYERNIVWQDPLVLWQDAANKSPHKIRPLLSTAWAYMARGDQVNAERVAKMIIKKNPSYALASNLLGQIADQNKQPDVAIQYFTDAISADPTQLLFYSKLGSILGRTGKYNESIRVSLAALAINSHYFPARINLGASYTKQEKYDLAIQQYLAIIKEYPRIKHPYSALKELYIKTGNTEEANRIAN